MKLKDLIVKAFEKAGIETPKPSHEQNKKQTDNRLNQNHKKKNRNRRRKRKFSQVAPTDLQLAAKARPHAEDGSQTKLLTGKDSPFNVPVRKTKIPKKEEKRTKTAAPKQIIAPVEPEFDQQFTLLLDPKSEARWQSVESTEHLTPFPFWTRPIPRLNRSPDLELRLGLDFGTSTTKVIIGDMGLQKAYAIPFYDCLDSQRYLLPSRLYLDNGAASLASGNQCFTDMKLRILREADNPENQAHVTLFLALVIRHAIAWLLTEQNDLYGKSNIAWRLAIGLPSIHLTEQRDTYIKFARSAWLLARTAEPLTLDLAKSVLADYAAMHAHTAGLDVGDIDVTAIPEIAAQIFGYVISDGFDPHDQKAFLLADVGAGTVDAALFRARRSKGKTNYDFYTANVELNGVMVLHQERLRWWERAITALQPPRPLLLEQLKLELDSHQAIGLIPSDVVQYFSGCELEFVQDEFSPDYKMRNKLIRQIRGDILHRAYMEGHWGKRDLLDIPFYLCGGGSRMSLYQSVQKEICSSHPNYTWLKASPRQITLPRNLVAPYLAEVDYDRLTVAYGLSFDDVGKVYKQPPEPLVKVSYDSIQPRTWWDRYIEK